MARVLPFEITIRTGEPTPCSIGVGPIPSACGCADHDVGPFWPSWAQEKYDTNQHDALIMCFEHCLKHGMDDVEGLCLLHRCVSHMASITRAGFPETLILEQPGNGTPDQRELVAAVLWRLEVLCRPLNRRVFCAMRGRRFLADNSGDSLSSRATQWLQLAADHGDDDSLVLLAEHDGVERNRGTLLWLAQDRQNVEACIICAHQAMRSGDPINALQFANAAIFHGRNGNENPLSAGTRAPARVIAEACSIGVQAFRALLAGGAPHGGAWSNIRPIFTALSTTNDAARAQANLQCIGGALYESRGDHTSCGHDVILPQRCPAPGSQTCDESRKSPF